MTRPVRVLVAEDSPTSRRLLCELLELDPDIRVIGEARNGREAVELVDRLSPDLLTLDLTMPEMDGLEAMHRILAVRPLPIVIVTSRADQGQMSFSMEALRAGALTVLPRPPGPAAPEFEAVAAEIQRTVKTLAGMPPARARRAVATPPPVLSKPPSPARPVDARSHSGAGMVASIVAIGTSAGGPPALALLLAEMKNLPVPIVIVQHIAHGFIDTLAAWLESTTGLRMRVATHDELLLPGTGYLAPDGAHLSVRDGRARLDSTLNVGRFKPAADVLFSSVADAYGPSAIGVILTGMGSDACRGARRMRDAGARIVVQDPATAAVSGMPEAAVAAGVASITLPLEAIAGYVRRGTSG